MQIVAPSRTLQVRAYDLGLGDVVSQEAYLRWTSDALHEILGDIVGAERMVEGFTMPMTVDTRMTHREPLRFLDRPEVHAGFVKVGATKYEFVARFTLHGIPIAEVKQRGLFVDTVSHAPTRTPERLRDAANPVRSFVLA